MGAAILGNPGVTPSVPTAFITMNAITMNAVGTEWVTPGLPRMWGGGGCVNQNCVLNGLDCCIRVKDRHSTDTKFYFCMLDFFLLFAELFPKNFFRII